MKKKHDVAVSLIEASLSDNTFQISWLSVQETGFVLAKLGDVPVSIVSKLRHLMATIPAVLLPEHFSRALELATKIGFKDFNDCLHTAVAETYCTDLYTFNHSDFKRIQPHTFLTIHLL